MKNYAILMLFLFAIYSCNKKQQPEKKPIKNPNYDKAFDFRDANQGDSAYKYFNEAKEIFLQHNDSLGIAKCLTNMAMIATGKGDYFGGQELAIIANAYFNESDTAQHKYIVSNYNNLGIASAKLEDYKQALGFYDLAIKYAVNSETVFLFLNNKANIYQEQKQYDEAINLYEQILSNDKISEEEYARSLTNFASTKWLKNSTYNPIPELKKALAIRQKRKDLVGLNSSYAHLADYYANVNPNIAFGYANQMYLVAKKINNPDDELRALRKLVNVSKPNETKQFFNRYQNLLDSLHNIRNTDKNQFALIRYETEKHKSENLKLQNENEQKNFYLIITMLFLIMSVIIALVWYSKRKEKMALELKSVVQENNLRTSKKVHDVVANGLYRVMAEIENNDEMDKESMLDKIEALYEKSRDISYDEMPEKNQNFEEKIASLLKSFATNHTKVLIVGNTVALWSTVNENAKYEIEHILQELMVNMKKHSRATNVAVRFEQLPNQINIYYTDNGIGLPKNLVYNNGLTNTGNRIDSINGKLTFDKEFDKGLKIYISIPIA